MVSLHKKRKARFGFGNQSHGAMLEFLLEIMVFYTGSIPFYGIQVSEILRVVRDLSALPQVARRLMQIIDPEHPERGGLRR